MREILFFCICAGIAAVFAPTFLTNVMEQKTANHAGFRASTPKKPEKQRSGRVNLPDTVEVKAGRNGHFVVSAEVNFTSVRFLVDTGASMVALRQSDAEASGIFLGHTDFNHPVSTANGTAFGAKVELESIAIDSIGVERVPALVLPDHLLGISLLGNSFLNRLDGFQVSENQLVMRN